MELKKSLPPPRDFSPMLAQAKYDTPSVRDAGLPRSAGWPAKLRADTRIDDLRGCVSLGRVRFAGSRRFPAAILGMGRPQIALRLAAPPLPLGRGRPADRGGRRPAPPPSRWAVPGLRSTRADPRRPHRVLARLLAGAARTPGGRGRHGPQGRSGMDH